MPRHSPPRAASSEHEVNEPALGTMLDRTEEWHNVLKLFGSAPLAWEGDASPTDFVTAAVAVASRFSQTTRLIRRLEVLVDRRALHNDPAAEIDEVSSMFSDDVKELEQQIQLLNGWSDRNTVRRSQRWQHCDLVISSLRSRAAGHTIRFQEALKKRTEASVYWSLAGSNA